MTKAFLINAVAIALVVGLHYEFLRQLSNRLPHLPLQPRLKIMAGVFGAVIAHATEIWIFAMVYWLQLSIGLGSLQGAFDGGFFDCLYFSFVSYTTLGYGDIYPSGPIRFLAGVESLLGLLLITWTASFLYLEMSKYWHR